MNFMAKFWRTFRLGMLVIMFVGVGFYLALTFPFMKRFGPAPSYARQIAEGEPIVAAIYKFRAERGLWPQYLDDLAPDYLPGRPSPKWNYEVLPGGPSLTMLPDQRYDMVGYDFDPVNPKWRAIEGYKDRTLKRGTPPPPTTLPAAALVERQIKELDRRIVNDRGWMQHWRAKASILRSVGRLEEARRAIAEARASDETHVWPRLAEAVLDLEIALGGDAATAPLETAPASAPAGKWPESAIAFETWVRAEPSLTRLYYVSLLHRLAGREADAIAVIEEAIALPAIVNEDDMAAPALYLWDMARFALARGKFDLVLKITGAWEKMQSDRRREENSYLALAAAAKLGRGDIAGARADLKRLRVFKAPSWAKNTDKLGEAIDRGDMGFRYDPGANPPPFQVFQLPE